MTLAHLHAGRNMTQRDHSLKWLYNITQEQYDQLLESQNGLCAICYKPPGARRLAVDHDHDCCPGKKSCGQCIRGLLCGRCNIGLGYFQDNIETLIQALMYLDTGA